MSDQDNRATAGLEGLLRRWGARSAMGEAEVPPVPSFDQEPLRTPDEQTGTSMASSEGPAPDGSQVGRPEPSPRTLEEAGLAPAWTPPPAAAPKPTLMLSRWLPLAVAAVLLLSSLVLFFHSLAGSGPAGQARQKLKGLTAQRDEARKDLQEAVIAVEAAKAELTNQKASYDEFAAKMVGDRQALQKTLGEKETQVVRLKEEASMGSALLAEMAPRLEAAAGEIKDARKLLAYKEKEAAELVRKVDVKRKRMAAAQTELDRLIKVNEEAARASQKAVNEMLLMRAQREALFADARRLYLSVKAPDEADLHASQMASRRSGMIARCGKLRAMADTDALRALLDKLEVFLTRLDLVDAGMHDEARAFTALVSTSKIVEEIDEALGSRINDEHLRTWVFEARLILMGTERVG